MPKSNRSGQALVLSPEQLRQVWNELDEPYRLVCEICYFTAARVGEVLALTRGDLQGDRIIFQKGSTKGKTTRIAQIGPELTECLARVNLPEKGYLFPSATGRPLTRQAIDKHLRRAAGLVGLQGVSTHSFRRSMATHLDSAGVGMRTIQRITGHKSLGNLERYLDVSTEQAFETQRDTISQLFTKA